jgi:hypothetical protein
VIDRVDQPGVVVALQVPQVVVGINDLQHAITPVVCPIRPDSDHLDLRIPAMIGSFLHATSAERPKAYSEHGFYSGTSIIIELA